MIYIWHGSEKPEKQICGDFFAGRQLSQRLPVHRVRVDVHSASADNVISTSRKKSKKEIHSHAPYLLVMKGRSKLEQYKMI